MDSSLLDENGNSLPSFTSTPKAKRKRPIYECPYCGKEYLVQFYFKNHVESHLSQAQPDVSQDVHLDVSDLSIIEDTPAFKKPAPPASQKKTTTKTVAKKTDSKRPKLICTYCLKEYICTRSFKSHLRTHTIQVAAMKYPDTEKILDNVVEISNAALTSVSNCPSYGKCGEQFRAFLGHVISEPERFEKFSADIAREELTAISKKK